MNINTNILEKAKETIRRCKEEQAYLSLCCQAEICPVCGSETRKAYGIVRGSECTVCTWREQ